MKRSKFRPIFSLLLAALLLDISGASAFAADPYPGDLDPSFGTGGQVIVHNLSSNDRANAVLVRPDGRILLGGVLDYNFGLAQLLADGSLDTTFGANGLVATPLSADPDDVSVATAMVLQPDGKVILAGILINIIFPMKYDYALARYTTTGDLDPTFGTGGVVITDFGVAIETPQAAVLQPDGKLVVAGNCGSDYGGTDSCTPVLARYNPNGSLDTSFGQAGKVIFTRSTWAAEMALALQPDGKILAAGSLRNDYPSTPEEDFDVMLFRLDPDGSYDTAFGANGLVSTDFETMYDIAYALALQPDGKIVLAGTRVVDVGAMILARYNSNGSPDASFGSGGKVLLPQDGEDESATALVLQPDGKILVGGSIYPSATAMSDFLLARFTPAGSPDASFGTAGRVTTDFGGIEEAFSLALQPDGRILLVGQIDHEEMIVARYINEIDELFKTFLPLVLK
jgi:uncharacterized delta-60 repeat protein